MKKRAKGRKSLFLALMMMLSLAFSNICVFADNSNNVNEEVTAARNGVVCVEVFNYDRDKNEYTLIQTGSGFLVGSDDAAGISTVITNHHVVYVNKQTQDAAKAFLQTDNLNLVIRVAVKRDTFVDATVFNQSESSDYAILTLATPIKEKKALSFAAEDSAKTTQEVYALGFPDVLTWLQDDNSYTEEDVNVTKGTIQKISTMDGMKYVQHDANLHAGNSGGPLVNKNGEVVGINVSGLEGNGIFYSLSSDEMTQTLKMLGVDFVQVPEPDPDPIGTKTESPEPTEEASADTSKLENAIDKFDDYKSSDYTKDSFEAYENAVNDGKDLLDSNDQDAIDQAVESISNAEDKLELAKADNKEDKKDGLSNTTLIIIIAAAVVVVIIVIIIIVVVARSGKKQTPPPVVQTPPVMTPPVIKNAPVNSNPGSDATTVLSGGGDAPTTMLNGQASMLATLVRLKTNENITVAKQVFGIGKDQSRVDYCISGNSSVSRRHAEIRVKNGAFYLVDLGSTNGTYLNGQRIQANQEMILKNNDRIKISDEEMQFKM